jgi:hypothetical protein
MYGWNFWKNKMVKHPKVAKCMLDSVNRVRNCVSLYMKMSLAYLRANAQCNASSYCTYCKVLPAIKVQTPHSAN